MGLPSYYKTLHHEMQAAERAPIRGGKTREQLEADVAQITATLAGPCDSAERIGLAADRKQLRRELEALRTVQP